MLHYIALKRFFNNFDIILTCKVNSTKKMKERKTIDKRFLLQNL